MPRNKKFQLTIVRGDYKHKIVSCHKHIQQINILYGKLKIRELHSDEECLYCRLKL